MKKTMIEWVKNPDGTQGYSWNPITGCRNGCSYCYARKLANGRLKSRYLANTNVVYKGSFHDLAVSPILTDPFYPREWFDRRERFLESKKPKGVFVCDMSDLFGIGIPESWTQCVLETIKVCPEHRFYLLTKQPQNLIKWSPFPDNCWVGVSATDNEMAFNASCNLILVEARIKYISFEPLLGRIGPAVLDLLTKQIKWVIIGAQTPHSIKTAPKWEWIKEIIEACDKSSIPVFLKNNLGLLEYSCEGGMPFYKHHPTGTMGLRREFPSDVAKA